MKIKKGKEGRKYNVYQKNENQKMNKSKERKRNEKAAKNKRK